VLWHVLEQQNAHVESNHAGKQRRQIYSLLKIAFCGAEKVQKMTRRRVQRCDAASVASGRVLWRSARRAEYPIRIMHQNR
jgi:hypothetical protein